MGVNRIGDNDYNSQITFQRALPWLQDTLEQDVWNKWQVSYRDVRILGPENQIQFVFNLTEHDLSLAENCEALKTRFLEAATVVDSDRDQLPDAWERIYLSGLDAKPDEDTDGDGIDNFAEFAFCSQPNNALSRPAIRPQIETSTQQRNFTAIIRRPGGSLLTYFAGASSDLVNLRQEPIQIVPRDAPRNLFDGTGAVETVYSLTIGSLPHQFLTIGAESMKRQ